MAGGERLGGRAVLAVLGTALIGMAAGAGTLVLYRVFAGSAGGSLDFPSGFLLAAVLVAAASSSLAIALVVVALRRRDGVDEVFLVHSSGLLLVHFSKTLKAEKDRDVVVAMLTAVQSFILETFAKGSPRELRRMDFGERTILLRKGTYSYLALVLRGRPALGLTHRMRRGLGQVERRYGRVLATWDGTPGGLSGADDLLLKELLGGILRQVALDIVETFARLASWRPWRRHARSKRSGSAKPSRVDPREEAPALLARPELRSLRPHYRDLMTMALDQIQEGQFTLAGVTNLYLTMALQKTPQPSAAGWWDEVLRTVRIVLQTWPWDPASQAWTAPPGPMAREASAAALTETPLPAPRPLPAERPVTRHPILPRAARSRERRPSRSSQKSSGTPQRSSRT